MKTQTNFRKLMALVLSLCLVAPGAVMPAFAGGKNGKKNFKEGTKYEAQQQWEQAATEYALAVAAEPDNAEYKLRYARALANASIMYTRRGDELAKQGDYAAAYDAYRKAFGYDRSNEQAEFKMKNMLELQKRAMIGGDSSMYDPNTGRIKSDSKVIQIENKPRNRDQMTDVSFKDIDLKECLKNLARNMNLNVLFDDSVKTQKVNFDLHDVTLARAFDMVLMLNKLTFSPLDRKTVLVFADNPQVRGRYEQMLVKTFYIGNIKASDARNIINAIAPGRQAPTIEDSKIMVVKATQGELQLIQNVLEAIDKNLSEVVIDVEIYEVSHDTMRQIGNQIAATQGVTVNGQYIDKTTGEPRTFNAGSTASLSNFGGVGRKQGESVVEAFAGAVFPWSNVGGLIGLPATTLSLLQSKGNSRLLNKMQVHALDGQSNNTKVGRSVPVSLGQNFGLGGFGPGFGPGFGGGLGGGVPGTGGIPGVGNQGFNQGFNNFAGGFGGLVNNIQYKDVGLVIEAKPKITNEGYVEIQMKIETSDVIAAADASLTPSFTQRSLNTTARIRDGVTSIVASINQDTNIDSRASIPVLGMLPLVGRLFTTPKEEKRQSDIVITVTPHIIRSAEITSNDNLALLGGTISQGGNGAGMNPSIEEVLLRAQLEEENDRRLIAMQNATPTQPQAPTSPLLQASQPNPLTVAQSNAALPQTALRNVGNFPDTSLHGPIGSAPVVKPVPTAEPNKTVINMKGDGSASPAPAPETKAIQMTGTPDAVMAPVAPTAIPSSPAAAAAAEWAKQYNKTEAQAAAEEAAAAAALTASTEPNAAEAEKAGKPKENQPVQPAVPQARVIQVTPPEHVQRAIQEAQLRAAKEREAARANPKPVQPEPEFKSEYFPPPAMVNPAVPRGVVVTNAKAKPNDSGIVGESGFNTVSIRGNQPLVRVANLSLSAAQKGQLLGKTLTVNLQLDAPTVLTNGTVALTFDASKLKVKAVKDGGMFSKPLDITFTETPGVVTINVNATNLKAAKNSGRLLIVEFETIGEGASEIAVSGADTQVRLSGEPANVNATSTQVLIAREK